MDTLAYLHLAETYEVSANSEQGTSVTGYFGSITEAAVIKFQKVWMRFSQF
jgi:peptidoglycan hydrolase-like protein with peptidoglycan-binding domain